MKIAGKHYRSIWVDDDGWSVRIIDQTRLPHGRWNPAADDLRGCGAGDPRPCRCAARR